LQIPAHPTFSTHAAAAGNECGMWSVVDGCSGRGLLDVESSRRQNSIESNDHNMQMTPAAPAASAASGLRKKASFSRHRMSSARESKASQGFFSV